MPRYFFDRNDGRAARDRDGRDLPDREAAQRHAMQIAAAYAGSPTAALSGGTIVVDVRDGDGAPAFTVRLVAMIDAA